MTRILYWNIEKFSLKKILDNSNPDAFDRSQDRCRHILNEVIAPHSPDMIIIVEVKGKVAEIEGVQGSLLQSAETVGGVLRLLEVIRIRLGHTWCVVPPLRSGLAGKTEGVAVYYNAASLTFTGPYIWAQPDQEGRRGKSSPGVERAWPPAPLTGTTAPLLKIKDYPGKEWSNALPSPANTISALQTIAGNPNPVLQQPRTWVAPDGITHVPEWRSAGQWEYTHHGPRIDNPTAASIGFPESDDRSPFYTRMRDNAGRTIKVFTVHTSPTAPEQGTRRISSIPELDREPLANEVHVVAGDFNIDSFSMTTLLHDPYQSILRLGYTMLLDPRPPGANNVNLARQPYCLTHLLGVTEATPFNNMRRAADPQHNVYPRFGYMGSSFGGLGDSGSIDNVFVRYRPGVTLPDHKTTIVNTAVGQPYTPAPPPPAGVTPDLTRGYQYDSSVTWPPGTLPAGIPPDTVVPQWFRDWQNFGRIASVSDHLAILFDV